LTEEQQAGTTPETMSEASAPEVVSVAEPATVVADVAAETPEPSIIEPAAEDVAALEPEPAAQEPVLEPAVEPEADAVAALAVDVAEPATEPAAEAVALAEPQADPAAVAEPVAVPEPAAEAVADVAAEPEPVADAGPDGVSPEDLADAPAAEEPDVVVPVVAARPEPSTMEELLAEQDTDIRSFKHGDVVEGAIVRIDKDEILVDIGAKSEGVVSNRELYGRNAESSPVLAVGDVVLVYVLQPESPEGHVVLSLRRAGLERKWRSMQEQFETGIIIEAPVIDHNKGGLIVDCGIRGFVPISQIVDFPRRPQNEQPRDAAQEIAEKLQPYVGRRLRLKILEVNRKANRLILSEKVALYEERREKRDELFSSLQVGQKVKGNIRSIAPFGVFVDLGGIDGLVHKSELSWNKVNNPEAGYKVGEEVEAEVIDINHERGRISLSIRRLQPDPWHSTVADFKVGEVIDGTVTKLVNFGAFVRVRDGLEGLIHISELSHQRVAHPGDVVREGQTIKLKIISLDSERHRLGLSLKQAEEAPARPAPEAPARPRRPREERGYAMSDAVQEPEGGIDNTLAAAFAQVRQQLEQAEKAEQRSPEAVPDAEPGPVTASEPASPEPEPEVEAELVAEAVVAPEQEPVTEAIAAEAEPVAEPETAPEQEPVTEAIAADPEPIDEAVTDEPEPVAESHPEPVSAPESDAEAKPAPEI
jgi:small subunit ribosomal protein S1